MVKIVLTGGPCAGKSSLTARISRELPEKGYKVFIVSEAASNLIISGIKPCKEISVVDFQDFVMDFQLANESIYENMEKFYPQDKIVVIYDRGLCDQIAYIDVQEFNRLLGKRGITPVQARDRYDAVLFLSSAALDGGKHYTNVNVFNGEEKKIREETADEAAALNEKTLDAWVGHQHLRVIKNTENFEEKMDMAMQEIYNILGEPVVTETERKFLIKRPSQEELNSMNMCTMSEIINVYLRQFEDNVERRIRQRGIDGDCSFYYTEKKDIPGNNMTRAETEKRISMKDYVNYLKEADPALNPVVKKRYCHVYDNQYFEIDIYDFDEEYAILELELSKEDQEIRFPDYIQIVKEVTNDKQFRNKSIAKELSFPV